MSHHGIHRLGEAAGEVGGVACRVVVDDDGGPSLRVGYRDGEGAFLTVGAQHLIGDVLAVHAVVVAHGAVLIGEAHVLLYAVVVDDGGKGVLLVLPRFLEGAAHAENELAHAGVFYLSYEGQGVHKHTHHALRQRIAATVADGGQAQVARVGIAAERIEGCCHEEGRRRRAEGLGLLHHVGRADGKRVFSVLAALTIQVGRHLRGGYTFAEQLVVVGFMVGRVGVLRSGELGITVGLGRGGCPFQSRTDFVHQDIERGTVIDKVVVVHQQHGPMGRVEHLDAMERATIDIKRADKGLLCGCYPAFFHLLTFYFRVAHLGIHLHGTVSPFLEMREQGGVIFQRFLYSLGQVLGLDVLREGHCFRCVVTQALGIKNAINVNALLGTGKERSFVSHICFIFIFTRLRGKPLLFSTLINGKSFALQS